MRNYVALGIYGLKDAGVTIDMRDVDVMKEEVMTAVLYTKRINGFNIVMETTSIIGGDRDLLSLLSYRQRIEDWLEGIDRSINIDEFKEVLKNIFDENKK